MLRKIVSTIMLMLLFIGMLTLAFNIPQVKAGPKTIVVQGNSPTIQEAINAANPGDTIFVKAGIYHEHIEINKSISLIGEDPTNTIIDGDGLLYIPIVLISKPNITFINFTIRNTAKDETYGILISKTQNVSLINVIFKETYCGIMLDNAEYCKILDNSILNNYAYGACLRSNSSNNIFIGNTIIQNPTGVYIADPSCQNNTFYHNNFINNENQAINYGKYNLWNDEYPSGGNYWSDYTGVDEFSGPNQDVPGSDDIGDTPYTDSFGVEDKYPLMNVWGLIPPIADFTYSPEKPVKNETITFDASASYDPDGNITLYVWDFGNGTSDNVTEPVIIHSYLDYGNYSVTLTVTDNGNLTGTITKIITVQKRISTLSIAVYPSTITIGESTTINGTLLQVKETNLPPLKETNVTIYYRVQGENQWQNLTDATTNAQGIYKYVWKPESTETYELKAGWEGDETTLPVNSSMVILTVSKRKSTLTINADPTTVTVGSNITITGKLTPVLEGVNITISSLEHASTFTWTVLAIVKTDSDGNYIYNWTTTYIGIYILNASWTGDEQTLGSQNSTGFIQVNKISSNITINVEPALATVGSNITINGTITPSRANVNVTIQFRTINETNIWNIAIQTDANGHYQYIWTPSNIGTYEIKASWKGDDKTLPAESETKTVNVEAHPTDGLLLAIIAIAIIILAAILIYFLKIRKH